MLLTTEAHALQRALTNILSSTRQRREAELNGHLDIMLRQLDALIPKLKAAHDEQQRQEKQGGSGGESERLQRLITDLEALRTQARAPA